VIVVLMGVAGAGKTTLGRLLAQRLGCDFAEGDAFHPDRNVEKMRAGIPLGDADRGPWLDSLAREIATWRAAGRDVVLACSALKRSYRERLAGGRPGLRFVHLRGDPALLRARLESRRGHFMPAAMLESQLEALEPPAPDERALELDVAEPPERLASEIATWLGVGGPAGAQRAAPTPRGSA
jgi:gluconokinase